MAGPFRFQVVVVGLALAPPTRNRSRFPPAAVGKARACATPTSRSHDRYEVEARSCRDGPRPRTAREPDRSRDRSWNWHGTEGTRKTDELLERGWDAFANAHAWYDPQVDEGNDPPREKQAYKLPHHEVIDGQLKVVWHGVNSAMQVLAGARGGVDIPDGDRKDVYRHLEHDYREFGKEPPAFDELGP